MEVLILPPSSKYYYAWHPRATLRRNIPCYCTFFEAATPKVTDTATPARAHEFMSDAAVEKHRAVNITPGLAEWELGCQLVIEDVASANMIHDRIATQSFHRMYCEQCIVENGET